jgi:hypothetical protein
MNDDKPPISATKGGWRSVTLNGWQRGWIVVSLSLVIPVAVGTWLTLPSEEPIKAMWANGALMIVSGEDDRTSVAALRQLLYPGLDNDTIIRKVRRHALQVHENKIKEGVTPVPSMLLNIAIVDDYYSRQLTVLQARQRKRMAFGGTVWLIMVVVAYGVARSAAWIRRR